MKLFTKLNQFTLSAVLSLALAFLIVHPGMFSTAHAERDSDFSIREYVERISPHVEPYDDWGLNPFYASRPLYEEDMAYMTAVCGGICTVIVTLIIGVGVSWAVEKLEKDVTRMLSSAWNGLRRKSDRMKFTSWATTNATQVGAEECSVHEGKGKRHADCIMDEWEHFVEEFVRQSNTCKNHQEWWGLVARTWFESTGHSMWECKEERFVFARNMPGLGRSRISTLFTWDTTPWTRY